MPQTGIYSAYQLGLHNHLDNNNGGILNDYSRRGAYPEAYRTGALATHVDNDTERTQILGVLTLTKQFTINVAYRGEWRIAWESCTTMAGQNITTQFWVNGGAIGALDTHNNAAWTPVLHNYDVDLAAGDLLQIYARSDGLGDCKVRNFRIYYDWAIKYFGDAALTLVTPLALTDTTAIDVTADV